MNKYSTIAPCSMLLAVTLITACGGEYGSVNQSPPPAAPAAPSVIVDAGLKKLIFSWATVPGATSYRLLENPDGDSGFTQTGADIPAGTLSVTLPIAVHLHDWVNALYMVQGCNSAGCTGSTEVSTTDLMLDTIGYFKASNPETGLENFNVEFATGEQFGAVVALSTDGSALAVGAPKEDGGSAGINGEQSDNSAWDAGSVYIFRLIGGEWSQQAYIKASNAGGGDGTFPNDEGDRFGSAVSLSSDGNTLAVGAMFEDSSATGINGDQDDNSAIFSGAAYVFRFDGANWTQQAYIKASNTEGDFDSGDGFGGTIALSADGNTLAVGAMFEKSSATGVNGDQDDNSSFAAGAVYIFRFDGTDWSQQAYVKASDTEQGDRFGRTVALSIDGNTLAVQGYVFRFDGTDWFEQACIVLETGRCSRGPSALSADGNTLLLGAQIFRFDGTDWFEQASIEFSNIGEIVHRRNFALSGDGNMVVMGERTAPEDDWTDISGAVHIFRFNGEEWPRAGDPIVRDPGSRSEDCGPPWYNDYFGSPVSLNDDGSTMAVGASGEDSDSPGIAGDRSNDFACESGAVYLY